MMLSPFTFHRNPVGAEGATLYLWKIFDLGPCTMLE
jgi:hypothetical protein